jgi:hypothetical protein
MSFDKIAALYVFCMNYHEGQGSRLYRLLSKLSVHYRIRLSDSAITAIADGKGRSKEEWSYARSIYKTLELKYAKY